MKTNTFSHGQTTTPLKVKTVPVATLTTASPEQDLLQSFIECVVLLHEPVLSKEQQNMCQSVLEATGSYLQMLKTLCAEKRIKG